MSDNRNKELSCMAQAKITVAQSELLDEMARTNNTTRSYELRMILELYGRERLQVDEYRKEMIDSDKACASLCEVFKEVYPVKEPLSSVPWYTGIHIYGVGIVGLLELEMINKSNRRVLFRYTNRFLPQIRKKYPELAPILERIIMLTDDSVRELTNYLEEANL